MSHRLLYRSFSVGYSHRLNLEVDLQSLFGLHVTWCAQLYTLAETPQLPPSPPIWIRITRALLVSQDRRQLFVTPWLFSLFVIPFLGLCCHWYLHNVQGKELSEQASKYKKEARKLLEEKEKSGKYPNQTKSKTTFRGPVLSHRQQIAGSFKCHRKGAYVWQNKNFILLREEKLDMATMLQDQATCHLLQLH